METPWVSPCQNRLSLQLRNGPGQRGARFHERAMAHHKEALDHHQASCGHQDPLDGDHVPKRSVKDQADRYQGAPDHGVDSEDPAQEGIVHSLLEQDGGWRVVERYDEPHDGHEEHVKPEDGGEPQACCKGAGEEAAALDVGEPLPQVGEVAHLVLLVRALVQRSVERQDRAYCEDNHEWRNVTQYSTAGEATVSTSPEFRPPGDRAG